MSRTPLIAGNWKMFKTRAQAVNTALALREKVNGYRDVDVLVCPPFTALLEVGEAIAGSTLALGAQNVHWEEEGAFTGEISTAMLLDCGCQFVVIGHSERRQYFNELDWYVNQKLMRVLATPLQPILCVGETLKQRKSGGVKEVVLGQLKQAVDGLTAERVSRIIIAYEPVWAIGTGQTATPPMAEEVHLMIREWLADAFSEELSQKTRILYGGSVKPDNSAELMSEPNIDGALVGGASLDADTFAQIVKYKE